MRKLKILLQQTKPETRALYAPIVEELGKLGVTTDVTLFKADLEAISRSTSLPLQLLYALERQISLQCMVEETKNVPAPTFFSTGVSKLDDALRGGLRTNQITEICGTMRSAMSKLSICSMIAYLRASSDAKVIHIDTKGTFDPRIIHEASGNLSSADCQDILARIECFQAFTVTHTNRVLEQIAASFSVRLSSCLIIVEDVSNILHRDWETTHDQATALTSNFGTISRFGCPILILRTVDKEKEKQKTGPIMANWEKIIDVRLFLSSGTKSCKSSCCIEKTREWVGVALQISWQHCMMFNKYGGIVKAVPDKSIDLFGEPCE